MVKKNLEEKTPNPWYCNVHFFFLIMDNPHRNKRKSYTNDSLCGCFLMFHTFVEVFFLFYFINYQHNEHSSSLLLLLPLKPEIKCTRKKISYMFDMIINLQFNFHLIIVFCSVDVVAGLFFCKFNGQPGDIFPHTKKADGSERVKFFLCRPYII